MFSTLHMYMFFHLHEFSCDLRNFYVLIVTLLDVDHVFPFILDIMLTEKYHNLVIFMIRRMIKFGWFCVYRRLRLIKSKHFKKSFN